MPPARLMRRSPGERQCLASSAPSPELLGHFTLPRRFVRYTEKEDTRLEAERSTICNMGSLRYERGRLEGEWSPGPSCCVPSGGPSDSWVCRESIVERGTETRAFAAVVSRTREAQHAVPFHKNEQPLIQTAADSLKHTPVFPMCGGSCPRPQSAPRQARGEGSKACRFGERDSSLCADYGTASKQASRPSRKRWRFASGSQPSGAGSVRRTDLVVGGGSSGAARVASCSSSARR